MPALIPARSTIIPKKLRHLRRLGTPNRIRQARAAPPVAYHGPPRRDIGRCGKTSAAALEAVVAIVSVAVTADVPLMETGEVVPKLKVGRSCAPVGLLVIAAVKTTLPVNPLLGVRVIVEVFSVVAPGAMTTDVPATAKLGGGGAVTVTVSVPVALA